MEALQLTSKPMSRHYKFVLGSIISCAPVAASTPPQLETRVWGQVN